MRLLYELQRYPKSIFVTLTFDEPSLRRFKDNSNKSLSLFLDRVRKKYGKQVRHWFIAEYGKKRGRLHYHGILFDIDLKNDDLECLWKYGNTFVGYANEITAKYIVKYLTKDDTKDNKKPPRVISSKGIGSTWLNTPECRLIKSQLQTYISLGGFPCPLPRFYIDKMYNEREKEIISYYNLMESPREYWIEGKKYTDYTSALSARNTAYKHYNSLGLVFSDDYEKRVRISSDVRFRVSLDAYTNYLFINNLI